MGLLRETVESIIGDKLLERASEWLGDRWAPAPSVFAALRVIEGRLPGLSDRWERKEVTFVRGRLRYRRWYLRAVTVTPTSVQRLSETEARVEAEGAALELAVPSDWMDNVQRWLGPGDGDTGRTGSGGTTH